VNDGAEDHEALKSMLEGLKAAAKESTELSAEQKAEIEKMSIPPMGEKLEVYLPQQLINQLNVLGSAVKEQVESFKENNTEAEVEALEKNMQPAIMQTALELTNKYYNARDEVESEVKIMKDYFRSQSEDRYKTKADVLRALWTELGKYLGKPVPPVDEELMAELENVPAVREGEYRHNWGIADKLYKSEAIDAFGMKYLLGVFDTVEDAQKAFDTWNSEYEKARADMKSEMQQWSKQENARLEADTSGADRIKKILEEARR